MHCTTLEIFEREVFVEQLQNKHSAGNMAMYRNCGSFKVLINLLGVKNSSGNTIFPNIKFSLY